MQKQSELLDHMIQEKDDKEREFDEVMVELGAKKAEVSTIKSYFEKAEAEKDKLQEEALSLKKIHTQVEEELSTIKKESE